jgi:hypothetical protein
METQNTHLFDIIIWSGAALSLLGLLGILWCIVKVTRARRAKLADVDMQAVLKSVLPLNLGALFLSIIGLMMVGVGIAFS